MEKRAHWEMAEIEGDHWWFSGRRAIAKVVIDKFVSPGPGWKILDAGCGTGGNLDLLSSYGDVTGMDLDEETIEILKTKNVGRILRGGTPDVPLKRESFEFIVMFDILEHIEDDVASMKALVELLKPGGTIVITVPAFAFLWSEHDRSHHHKRHYTLPELETVMTKAGLHIEYSSYFNILLFPIIALIRLTIERIVRGNMADHLSLPNPLVNACLRSIFSFESLLIGRLKFAFGVSIIACGRKPGGVRST